MLVQDKIYLEGFGTLLGIPYFCGIQPHLGYVKLVLFVTLFTSFPFLLDRFPLMAILTVLGDQLWNVIILYDIIVFLWRPATFKGFAWSPSDHVSHLIENETPLSQEKLCVMLIAYVAFLYICVPYTYALWTRFVYSYRHRHHEEYGLIV